MHCIWPWIWGKFSKKGRTLWFWQTLSKGVGTFNMCSHSSIVSAREQHAHKFAEADKLGAQAVEPL